MRWSLVLLFSITFSFSAQAFTPDFNYDCEKFYKPSTESEFTKEQDNFTLSLGLSSGFLGFGPAWMSLTNQRTGSYLRFGIGACSKRPQNGFIVIDDRCAELYSGDDFGYFNNAGSTTSAIDGLPNWANANLILSESALTGDSEVQIRTSEFGGENPDGSVRVNRREWRCVRL